MKAIIYEKYGAPDVLRLADIPKPQPKAGEVLVRVRATAVNSADWRLRKADPFLVRLMFGLFAPRIKVLGGVFSGVVEAVGPGATRFQAGDEVFGLSPTTILAGYAEYLALPETVALAIKPQNLSHEEAACLPFGGHTALHFLKKADLHAGQRVLIYGASGSVGVAAVQLAKHYGASVTAVCGPSNVAMVKALGADEVMDYTQTDLTTIKERFDLVIETVNKAPVAQVAALLKPGGALVLGAAMLKAIFQGLWLSFTQKIKLLAGEAQATPEDITFLKTLAEAGKLKPAIDRTYPLEQMQEAHAYVERGHKKGNVAITIAP
jgi:NADPH:quinone reductase-like Zn-dependent oxidoreductase